MHNERATDLVAENRGRRAAIIATIIAERVDLDTATVWATSGIPASVLDAANAVAATAFPNWAPTSRTTNALVPRVLADMCRVRTVIVDADLATRSAWVAA